MDAGERVAQQIESMRRLLAQGEPGDLRGYLAVPSGERPVAEGSTVPLLVSRWRQRGSGLFVPDLPSPGPLDLVLTYLTPEEIFGGPLPPDYSVRQLRALPLATVLTFCALVLNVVGQPDADRREVDRFFADSWLPEPIRSRVLNLLRDRSRGLIVPQAVMVLARSAFEHCPPAVPAGTAPGNVIGALLALAQDLGRGHTGPSVISDQPGDLGRELIANQYFNQVAFVPYTLARFVRRWRELPGEMAGQNGIVDLAEAYETCTGVSLDDLVTVGALLWAYAIDGKPVIPLKVLEDLPLPQGRAEAVLSLISADLDAFGEGVREERDHQHTEWTFDTFQRWPVIRISDGMLLVLDHRLLVDRTFGWLPLNDIKNPPPGRSRPDGHRKLAARAATTLQRASEAYVLEVLRGISGDRGAGRVYDDADLKAAFERPGQRIADAAVDYGDTWVVVEVTTTQLRRDAALAVTEESQVEDIDKLLGELDQIQGTIDALRREERRLTGVSSAIRRRYLPLLLLTEGFPVNPVSLTVIRERARARGLLQADDVLPVEVLDVEELEMIEALQEQSGTSLLSVILAKQASSLRLAAVRNHILCEQNLGTMQSERISRLWPRVFAPIAAMEAADQDTLPAERPAE